MSSCPKKKTKRERERERESRIWKTFSCFKLLSPQVYCCCCTDTRLSCRHFHFSRKIHRGSVGWAILRPDIRASHAGRKKLEGSRSKLAPTWSNRLHQSGQNGVYSSSFRAQASGGHSKARETRDAPFMQKFTRFALLDLGPAQLRVCECPPPQIPVSQSPF